VGLDSARIDPRVVLRGSDNGTGDLGVGTGVVPGSANDLRDDRALAVRTSDDSLVTTF
jgi:hypothetical protein